jgi:hypothetical protein
VYVLPGSRRVARRFVLGTARRRARAPRPRVRDTGAPARRCRRELPGLRGGDCRVHGGSRDAGARRALDVLGRDLAGRGEASGGATGLPVPGDGRIPAPPDEPPYQRAGYERPPVDADGRSWWPHDRAVSQLYGRLDTELAERLAARLRPEPQALFGAPYPPERPPEVPSAFLYAREDEQFDDEWSRWIARSLLGLEAIELPSGHFPMLPIAGASA